MRFISTSIITMLSTSVFGQAIDSLQADTVVDKTAQSEKPVENILVFAKECVPLQS